MQKKTSSKKGRPSGIPREGKYGTGVKTVTVRVPVAVADTIPDIINAMEQIKVLVEIWEDDMEENARLNNSRKLSPRYEKARILLDEFKEALTHVFFFSP